MTSSPPASRRLYKEGNFNQKFSLSFSQQTQAVQQASWAARNQSSQRTSLQLGVWAFTSPAFSCWLPGPRGKPGRLENGWVSGCERVYVAKNYRRPISDEKLEVFQTGRKVTKCVRKHFGACGKRISKSWKHNRIEGRENVQFWTFCAIFILQIFKSFLLFSRAFEEVTFFGLDVCRGSFEVS